MKKIYCICSVHVNQQIMFTSQDISLNLYVSTCGRTSRGWMVQHRSVVQLAVAPPITLTAAIGHLAP